MPAPPKSWWTRQITQLRSHLTPRAFGKGQYFDSPKSTQILRSASSALSPSIIERFSLWIQGRQDDHFGPKCRLPELFQRRDKIYLDLQAKKLTWNHPPPKYYHDVLRAAANVGAIEERLGYKFKDILLGIEALKNSGVAFPLYFSGQVCKVDKNNRLALLGDRILTSVLCDMWYDSGQSTNDYHHNVVSLETRFALNKRGRDLRIDENIIIARDNPTDDQVAETFEAIIGAIYEDSGKDIRVAKTIIKEAGFVVPTPSPTNVPAIHNASVLRPSTDAPALKKRRGLNLVRRISLSSAPKSLPSQQTATVTKISGLLNWLTLGKFSGREKENKSSKQDRHQAEGSTAKDSSTATKTAEILQQEQPQLQGLVVNDSSNLMVDNEIPQHEILNSTTNMEHAIGERKESIWVKAVQTYDRLQVSNPPQSGGSPASVEKIYGQMMQQEVRARRVEQKLQSRRTRKQEELEREREDMSKRILKKLRRKVEARKQKEEIYKRWQEGQKKEGRRQKKQKGTPLPKDLAKATEKSQNTPTAKTQNKLEATEIARPNKESITTVSVVYRHEKTEKTEVKATKQTHHVSSTLKQERQSEEDEKVANSKVELLPTQNTPVKSKKSGKKSNVQVNVKEIKGETLVETRHASTSTKVTATSITSKQNAQKSKPPQSQQRKYQSQRTPNVVESLKVLEAYTAQLQRDIETPPKPIEIEVPQLREIPQEELQQKPPQKTQQKPQQKPPKKLGKAPKPPPPQTTDSEVEVDTLAESADNSNSDPAKTELESTIVVPRQSSNDDTPLKSKLPSEEKPRTKEPQRRPTEKEAQAQQGADEKPWKEDALATQSQQGEEGKPWKSDEPWKEDAQGTQW